MELFEQFFKQREIKFKAWDKKRKVMIPCATVDMEWHKMRTKEKDRYILVQYTGLQDKNGKEIYEGDIVNFEREGNFVILWNNKNYAGVWTFSPISFQIYSPCWYGDWDNKKCEVIGNIFENPELLNPDNF